MKVLNYLVCSVILFIGIALILTDNLILIIAGIFWFVLNVLLSTINSKVRLMWKSYIKSTIKMEKKLGMY